GGEPWVGLLAVAGERRRLRLRPAARGAVTDEDAPALERRRAPHEIEVAVARVERRVGFELRARDPGGLPRHDARGGEPHPGSAHEPDPERPEDAHSSSSPPRARSLSTSRGASMRRFRTGGEAGAETRLDAAEGWS